MTTESLDNPSQKLHICFILLFGILFVFPALNDGLVSDDFELIEEAQFAHPYNLLTFFSEPGHKGFYRPLERGSGLVVNTERCELEIETPPLENCHWRCK